MLDGICSRKLQGLDERLSCVLGTDERVSTFDGQIVKFLPKEPVCRLE